MEEYFRKGQPVIMSVYTKQIPYLFDEQRKKINKSLLDPIEYRKSGLSINHIIGCPLDCTYCVRHVFDNYSMRQPNRICSDEEAIKLLMSSKYYCHGKTPIQIFNRATDPFLPNVKKSTLRILELLSEKEVSSPILIITRYKIKEGDIDHINQLGLKNLTILVTYSGISDKRIEPVSSRIAAESLKLAYSKSKKFKVILYWRPIIPGLNDSDNHIRNIVDLSKYAHATAFTGLFYRNQIKTYYEENGLPELYKIPARRKILPEKLDRDILTKFFDFGGANIFRKTSCAVSFAHRIPDYNGHYGIRELCDICPKAQIDTCASAWFKPNDSDVKSKLNEIDLKSPFVINDRAIEFEMLSEQNRYFVQHGLNYQAHEKSKPHLLNMHGRADINE